MAVQDNSSFGLDDELTPREICLPTSDVESVDVDPLLPNNTVRRELSNGTFQNCEVQGVDQRGSCVRRLSQLSIDLFQHGSTIPSHSIHDTPSLNDNMAYSSNYVLEDTILLTQSLIDIYPPFLDSFLPRLIPQTSRTTMSGGNLKSNLHFKGSLMEPKAMRSPSPSDPLAFDHSSIYLIISCHLRLIDIYAALAKHMRLCVRGGEISKIPVHFEVPDLKIGNYTPPLSTAVPMLMLLFTQFGSQLHEYAAELSLRIGKRKKYAFHNTPESELAESAAENVKARAVTMAQDLGLARDHIVQSLLSNSRPLPL